MVGTAGPSGCAVRPMVAPTDASSDPSPVRAFVPARRSFFDEGLHAFQRCFVHHVARHDLTRRVGRVRDTQLDLAVEKLFSH